MVIDSKFVTINIKDGSTFSIAVKLGEGNITWDEKVNRQYILDRGNLDTVRNGDQVPVDVSIDSEWLHLTGQGMTGATPTVEDALKRRGPAAGWVSSSSDPCEPFAVDIELVFDPDCATDMRETITLADFRYESVAHDLKAGTLKITGKCNVTEANAVRSAQTA